VPRTYFENTVESVIFFRRASFLILVAQNLLLKTYNLQLFITFSILFCNI